MNICTIPPRMEKGFLTLATFLGEFLLHECLSYCSAPSVKLFPSTPLAPCSPFEKLMETPSKAHSLSLKSTSHSIGFFYSTPSFIHA